ncbi:MAG: pyrroline-5-carboxylate reductase [Bdellovibrio sp.]|nr:MAG: pyrroline-5-carboxylate reductase [Bdellovibrio sp.]
MVFPYKIGFIGVGNLAQAMIKTLLEKKVVAPNSIFASNRSPGKLQKAVDTWGIQAQTTNEQVVDASDIVILAVKPQDVSLAVDPIARAFRDKQLVISLAAGISLRTLGKKLPECRIVRAIPNIPSVIQKGVIGCVASVKDTALEAVVADIFSPMGMVIPVSDEDELEALMVSCSSGTGFVYELMMYFQDWIAEHGFEEHLARKMVVETFLGAALLASQSPDQSLEDLQNRVASKKGVTAAGLDSMREWEIERALRYAFEKAALRNQELAKQSE